MMPSARLPRSSATTGNSWVIEEIILECSRLVLDGADAMHELAQAQRIARFDLDRYLGILDDLYQKIAIRMGLLDAQIGVCRFFGMGLDEFRRVVQRIDEGFICLGIVLAVLLRGIQHSR